MSNVRFRFSNFIIQGISVSIIFVLAACGQEAKPDPEITSVDPKVVSINERVLSKIEGRYFYAEIRNFKLDSKGLPSIDSGFSVYVNQMRVDDKSVFFRNTERIDFVVPTGLPEGTYDVSVFTPTGQSASLEEAFRVRGEESTETDSEEETDTVIDTSSDTDVDTDVDSDTDTDVDTDTDTDVDTDTDSDSVTTTDTPTERETDTRSDTETGTDIDSGPWPDSGVDAGDTDTWPMRLGHWQCNFPFRRCYRVYEMETCGDGNCDPIGGESDKSCPVDCDVTEVQCLEPIDCVFLPWPVLEVEGHWECIDSRCYAIAGGTCGNAADLCQETAGESLASCPSECNLAGFCFEPKDCIYSNW